MRQPPESEIASPCSNRSLENIDNVLWKEAGCTTELDYTEQTSWLLFLKYLDELEREKATEAKLEGKKYAFILDTPYRWGSWAAPKGKDGQLDHHKAKTGDDLRDFVNQTLFPYRRRLDASPRRVDDDLDRAATQIEKLAKPKTRRKQARNTGD